MALAQQCDYEAESRHFRIPRLVVQKESEYSRIGCRTRAPARRRLLRNLILGREFFPVVVAPVVGSGGHRSDQPARTRSTSSAPQNPAMFIPASFIPRRSSGSGNGVSSHGMTTKSRGVAGCGCGKC